MLDILQSLNNYSFNNKTINIIKRQNIFLNNNQVNRNNENNKKYQCKRISNIYSVIDKNIFFWIFYILQNDYNSYLKLDNNLKFKVNRDLNYEIINKLNNNNTIKKSLKEKIISNLGNMENLEVSNFKHICILYNFNICLVHNLFCEIIICNNEIDDFYIIDIKGELYNKKLNMNEVEKKYIIVNDINKPIKSFSYYKLIDLQEICKRLNINIYNENNKKKTKKDLYEKLLQYL